MALRATSAPALIPEAQFLGEPPLSEGRSAVNAQGLAGVRALPPARSQSPTSVVQVAGVPTRRTGAISTESPLLPG